MYALRVTESLRHKQTRLSHLSKGPQLRPVRTHSQREIPGRQTQQQQQQHSIAAWQPWRTYSGVGTYVVPLCMPAASAAANVVTKFPKQTTHIWYLFPFTAPCWPTDPLFADQYCVKTCGLARIVACTYFCLLVHLLVAFSLAESLFMQLIMQYINAFALAGYAYAMASDNATDSLRASLTCTELLCRRSWLNTPQCQGPKSPTPPHQTLRHSC